MRLTAIRMLMRDWRGGELGVLASALVIAVAIVAGIAAFTSRLQSSLEQEAHRFLAADRVISSSHDIDPSLWSLAEAAELQRARTLTFPSMVYSGEEDMYLASVKAVTNEYPLRGELVKSAQPFGDPEKVQRGPEAGTVWIDSRLFPLLNVEMGGSITIGEADFEVVAAVRSEPDQTSGFFGYGPRVLMNYADIGITNVVQPGSRVNYRLLLAGDDSALDEFVETIEPTLVQGERLLDVEDGQGGIGNALDRAEQFLLLAGSLGVVLAGVAIALAARRFSERHYDYVAIMKSLGATSGNIGRLYGSSLLLLGTFATLVGCAVGWAIQEAFFAMAGDSLPIQPGTSGVRPYLMGAVTALVCLLSFAWPPLSRLAAATPLRVLRRDIPGELARTALDYALGLGAVVLLMLWYSRDLLLTLAVLAGLLVTATLAGAAAAVMLRGGRLAGMRAGSVWRLALAGLQRRGGANILQVVIFSMAIMLLLILILVRTSLIEEWQMQLPEGTPNHFLVNVAPYEVDQVRQALEDEGILSQPLFPMVRGRMIRINDEALGRSDDPSVGRRERETNLTWSREIPSGNELTAGEWWDPDTTEPLVSLEADLAERLEVVLGDEIHFLVGSQALTATVSSIRSVEWESLQPNFFIVLPPAVLKGYPATYMTSFHLDPEKKQFLNEFIREFPTVSLVEMDVVITQVRMIIGQVSAAIELVLAVILAAGGLVLIAGVEASVDTRLHETAILRAFGASRRLVLGSLFIEFCALGFFAGLLATIAAELSVLILQTQVLEMNYTPHPTLWLLGPVAGVLLIGCLGVWSCRHVVSTPPVLVLREL
jgi:putative ABC transport system permease protein